MAANRGTLSQSVGRSPIAVAATRKTRHLSLYVIMILLSILFFFPFFWTIMSSLKSESEVWVSPPLWLPKTPQWGNYWTAWTMFPVARWLLNTANVVLLHATGMLISASLVAYSFARFRYRGRDLLFMITLGTMMLPAQVTLIPQYLLFFRLHWIDTIKPLWVPAWFGGGAFNIFLLRQFMLTLPQELDEAARVDGASRLRILVSILLPLMKPALATALVINFISTWNDFMGPMIYLNTPEKLTIAVGLRWFSVSPSSSQPGRPQDHLLMAACVTAFAPCIVLFFTTQRYFVRGIVMSGIKG